MKSMVCSVLQLFKEIKLQTFTDHKIMHLFLITAVQLEIGPGQLNKFPQLFMRGMGKYTLGKVE